MRAHKRAVRRRKENPLPGTVGFGLGIPDTDRVITRCIPLLCHNLNKFYDTALPKAVRDELQGFFRANTQRNLSLAGKLLKTRQSLAENGIDALAFKGPVLAAIDADSRIRRVSRLIQSRLFDRTRKLGLLEKATIFFMTQEHLRNRLPHLAYSFHKAVTPNQADTSFFYLPSCLYFLYYPLRAMRLSRAALGRMLSRTH